MGAFEDEIVRRTDELHGFDYEFREKVGKTKRQ